MRRNLLNRKSRGAVAVLCVAGFGWIQSGEAVVQPFGAWNPGATNAVIYEVSRSNRTSTAIGEQGTGTAPGPQNAAPALGQPAVAPPQSGAPALGRPSTVMPPASGGTAIGPQGGTAIGPQSTPPAITAPTGPAMGPQRSSPALGQQPGIGLPPSRPGSPALGPQGGTAIGPQSGAPALGRQPQAPAVRSTR
jgi:hypothetical protein